MFLLIDMQNSCAFACKDNGNCFSFKLTNSLCELGGRIAGDVDGTEEIFSEDGKVRTVREVKFFFAFTDIC